MSEIDEIRLDGGRLCLDFVNTVHDRFETPQRDYLNTVRDLIDWSLKADIIDVKKHRTLKKTIRSNSQKAKLFFAQAINLRELLYSLFLNISKNQEVQNKDVEEFNGLVSDSFSRLKIKRQRTEFLEGWNIDEGDLINVTLPIIKDAYDLLLYNRHERIRECPKCGWIFFDSSKNGRRRWCSMEICGSRAKAVEWYQRNKENN